MTFSIDSVKQIGELIRKERKRQGVRQQDLADLSGVSWHFLSNLENGKSTVEFQKVLLVLRCLGIGIQLETRSPTGPALRRDRRPGQPQPRGGLRRDPGPWLALCAC